MRLQNLKRLPAGLALASLCFASGSAFLAARLGAQTAAVYQPPQAVIDPAAIDELERQLNEPDPDLPGIAERARAQVQLYTGQFVRDRLIQDERNRAARGVQDMDEDIARLIALLQSRKYGQIQFLGEYPYLFRLHVILARVYEVQDDPEQSLAEYLMALRFSGREQPWEAAPDAQQQDQRYQLMARTFGDPDRLAQIADPAERAAGQQVRPLLQAYLQLQLDLQAAERAIFVSESAQLRGRAGDPAAARASRDALQTRLQAAQAALEQIRLGPYAAYHRAKSEREGLVAYHLALLARRLESDNRTLQRILNRSSYYRGAGNQLGEERTTFTNFVGYRMFLELALVIDPENLKYLDLMTEECRSSRLVEQAIAYQERYLQLARAQPAAPDNLPEHYVRLAGLYTDARNYIRAVQAYREFLQMSQDEKRRDEMSLELADLCFRRVGCYEEAAAQYSRLSAQSAARESQTDDLRMRSDLRSGEYRMQRNLAAIQRRWQRSAAEEAALDNARAVFERLRADWQKERDALVALERRIFEIKRQLLSREDEAMEREYYRLVRIDQPAIRERIGFLKSRLDSLDLPALLEERAMALVRRQQYREAQSVLREIIASGRAEQSMRARRNMELLSQTLQDGRRRPLDLPPDYQR
ncbi:MAG: hypothetical protein K1X75_03195 [Leptospirales bacterium]|nr:hypothetical protein [Leptospirales bacterium]